MKQQPIVAFLYDFDKTLCTTDMQDYAFIPSLGMTPAEFWAEANGFGRRNRMDGILAYMYTMLREAGAAEPTVHPDGLGGEGAEHRAVPRCGGLVPADQRLRRRPGCPGGALHHLFRPAGDH